MIATEAMLSATLYVIGNRRNCVSADCSEKSRKLSIAYANISTPGKTKRALSGKRP